jgi:hypothetical protein
VSSRPLNAGDERWRFGAFAVRITPTPRCRLTTGPADVCSLLNKHQTVASPECERLASRRAVPVALVPGPAAKLRTSFYSVRLDVAGLASEGPLSNPTTKNGRAPTKSTRTNGPIVNVSTIPSSQPRTIYMLDERAMASQYSCEQLRRHARVFLRVWLETSILRH